MKTRGFEIASGWENKDIRLPRRQTAHAAAYDIEAAEDTVVPKFQPGVKPTLVATGLKAYCQPDECYFIFNRSSGASKGLVLANGVGIIDADYYNNPETVYTEKTEQKLDNTIDFIQNYYYHNRFRLWGKRYEESGDTLCGEPV